MSDYVEQSVLNEPTVRSTAMYAVCRTLAALFVAAAIACALGILREAEGAIRLNWINIGAVLVCAAAAVALFRFKDHFRTEYDYVLRDDVIEVSAIYNGCRRRVIANIDIEGVQRCGRGAQAPSQPGLRRHDWYIREGAAYYFIYNDNNSNHMALLEINQEMANAIRRSRRLRRGAWQVEEGKTI